MPSDRIGSAGREPHRPGAGLAAQLAANLTRTPKTISTKFTRGSQRPTLYGRANLTVKIGRQWWDQHSAEVRDWAVAATIARAECNKLRAATWVAVIMVELGAIGIAGALPFIATGTGLDLIKPLFAPVVGLLGSAARLSEAAMVLFLVGWVTARVIWWLNRADAEALAAQWGYPVPEMVTAQRITGPTIRLRLFVAAAVAIAAGATGWHTLHIFAALVNAAVPGARMGASAFADVAAWVTYVPAYALASVSINAVRATLCHLSKYPRI